MLLPDDCLLKARLLHFRDDEGYEHHVRYWKPQRLHQATILFLHGIQSHSGWYGYSCQRLAEAGFEVIFPDRRGSGLSRQDRGHVASVRQLQRDVCAHLAFIRREFPLSDGVACPPLFLAGISWGGRLAATLASDWSRMAGRLAGSYARLAGLALLYPGIHTHYQPTVFQKLLLKLFARDIFGTFHRDIPTNTPELFTRTPEFLAWMKQDEKTLRRASVSFFRVSQTLQERAAHPKRALNLPALLMLAGQDEIIDNHATKCWFENFVVAEKTCHVYPDARHTLEFETGRDQMIADLTAWLRTYSRRDVSANTVKS